MRIAALCVSVLAIWHPPRIAFSRNPKALRAGRFATIHLEP
ncbi:hypothetical protein PC116_g14768 [Phytophthora cactorum]|uniref:Uncharacterized protein n=1 Tax=Phytophthora cactorum TaxID=29920 RepID=A0A8T1D8Q8_9STRA|nr:hypothetical protein PC117_g11531 [Phytophthora cactorum]KAG3014595.1 hypothetical protein PC120_g12598 [Phytophthora cactorum]KAG4237157.1 hypothetical protein PC116_g14768 [Phytophthora cactorum]